MDTKKKRTPNQKKKAIVSVLLMVAILITGAFAFLSATDSKTNVFTVGNVKIKLSEEFDTNQNGSIEKTNDENDEVYDASETQVSLKGEILPGQKVIKRPYVENTGKNKAWVYITVGIPTTNSDNTFRNKKTGETSITGQNVDIPIQAYAIQENYANKTTYKDVWNAYFADKVTDTFGAEVTDAKTLSERVPLFEILNKTRFNEPIPDNISVDDNIPNDDWENIGITVDGQEKSYYKSANYDYYVFAYKTLLDPTADGAEQLNRTSDVFEGVRLLKDIGEAQPSKLNYYIKETAGNTLNGEVDLSVEPSTYDGYRLVKTEYYMPGERVRNLYYDDTLAETGYSFNWNFMNDKTKSAYSGMVITEDTDLVATYEDTVSNTPKEPTEVPVIKYSPSGYLGYAIEQNDDGSYYATLIGADETRSDYPEAPTEVLVPNAIKILENSDGTKLLEDGVIMHGSIDNFPGGTQIPVKKIQLAEWQWDSSTMNYAAPEAVALGKIAKKLNVSGTNIEEIKFCGDIYQHNITSGFVLEDIGTLPSSLTTLNEKAFYSCVNLKSCKTSNFLAQIGDNAFNECKALETIDMSDSVTNIGDCAFLSAGITNVTIPNQITIIGYSVFGYCPNLTSVTIPCGVTNIGSCAFAGCAKLTNVIIPNSVETIGGAAFSGTGITNIIIPDSVTNIDGYVFKDCKSLTSITMPDSITSIGNSAFECCFKLRNITIPNSVTSIGERAFLCSGLTSITLPNSVKSIGASAFNGGKFTNIIIPDSVTSIGNSAFSASGLKSVTIGKGVTNIGNSAFGGCSELTNLTVNTDNKDYASKDGILYTKDFSELLIYPARNTTENLVLPEGLKKIPNSAFRENNYIKAIAVPSTVTEIGKSIVNSDKIESIAISSDNPKYDSRNNCNAIIETATNTLVIGCQNTIIPDGITSIGKSAFFGCSGITSIVLPNSVENIGEDAFGNCMELQNVTFGSRVTSIGNGAFSNCQGLKSVTIPDSVKSIEDTVFFNCQNLQNITIGNGATNISGYAFYGCFNLANIAVSPNNPKYDSRNNCNAIIETATNTLIAGCKNTTIPDGIICISEGAFQGAGITNVIIPDSVTKIGSNTFAGCYNLTNITIGDSVTSIGDGAFRDCSQLTSITIPDNVTNIGEDAFTRCTGLISVTIGHGITNINNNTFYGCSGLTNISIPDGVEIIGSWTFEGCSSLKSISLPDSITKIGYSAFSKCTNLTSIIYRGSVSDWAKVDCPPGSFASGLTITCTDGTVSTQ